MLTRSFCGRSMMVKAVRIDLRNYRQQTIRWLSAQTEVQSQPPKPPGLMKRYEDWLERSFPTYYRRVHRVFVDGSKSTLKDIKMYWHVRKDMRNGRELSSLNKDELEVLIQIPQELSKMVFTTVLIVVPFGAYLIVPAMIFLPRLVLTRHFWTPEQRREFWSRMINMRQTRHYEPIAKAIDEKLKIKPPLTFDDLNRLAANSDRLPDLRSLDFSQKYHLCRSYGILPTAGCIDRLERRTIALQAHDSVMRNQNLEEVDTSELHTYMNLRQLPFAGKSDAELRKSLRQWLDFSTGGKASAPLNLLVYAPILLNKPPEKPLEKPLEKTPEKTPEKTNVVS